MANENLSVHRLPFYSYVPCPTGVLTDPQLKWEPLGNVPMYGKAIREWYQDEGVPGCNPVGLAYLEGTDADCSARDRAAFWTGPGHSALQLGAWQARKYGEREMSEEAGEAIGRSLCMEPDFKDFMQQMLPVTDCLDFGSGNVEVDSCKRGRILDPFFVAFRIFAQRVARSEHIDVIRLGECLSALGIVKCHTNSWGTNTCVTTMSDAERWVQQNHLAAPSSMTGPLPTTPLADLENLDVRPKAYAVRRGATRCLVIVFERLFPKYLTMRRQFRTGGLGPGAEHEKHALVFGVTPLEATQFLYTKLNTDFAADLATSNPRLAARMEDMGLVLTTEGFEVMGKHKGAILFA